MKAITGSAEIAAVERLPVTVIKRDYLKFACISEADFDSYYLGHVDGSVLWLTNVIQFNNPIPLQELRKYGFTPPQSFSYLTEDVRRLIEVQE